MRSCGITVGPKSNDSIFIRDRKDTQTQRGGGQEKTEAETRVMLQQARE